jgi:hypothetical protein
MVDVKRKCDKVKLIKRLKSLTTNNIKENVYFKTRVGLTHLKYKTDSIKLGTFKNQDLIMTLATLDYEA